MFETPHRTFSLRIGEQGSDHNADDWVIDLDAPLMEGGNPMNPREVAAFKEEILERFKSHLDSCMSAGYWNFQITSSDWPVA